MSFPTQLGIPPIGSLHRDGQVCLGPAFALSQYKFFATGTGTPANVYQNATLTTAYPNVGIVTADAFGRFPPIYLDGSLTYKVQFFDSSNTLRWTADPYTPPLSTRGLSTNVAFGPQIAATGELVLPAPAAGGTQITLTLKAGSQGAAPLQLSSTLAGQPALLINTSATTGVQTATFTATNKPGTATSSPAGWLPLLIDGVVMYTPIWHGNNFTPYVANAAAVGETINATTVTLNGDGSTSVTGGSATPSSWFAPNASNIGGGFWINITKTGGLSGLAFTAAQGAWTNITNGGLAIASNHAAQINGTYQLSTSVTGSPVVASGTVQLQNGNGVQDPNYSGAASLILGGDGTATLNGVATSNWLLPTTPTSGHLYWINITLTGGTANFSAAQGAWTNITDGGLTIGLTGSGQRNATGTYQISSNAGGTALVASGTISLTGSGVNNTNYSGTAPLVLAGDGTATLNGVAQTNWFSPTTANTGSGYWINITRTSGTSGVNFSQAQGSWANITNSGLSITLTGTTGNVGTVTASGTYQLSNSSGGSPVLGSGTVSISISGLTIIHIYTTAVTNATETIPSGTTNVKMECWGAGGGGGPKTGTLCSPIFGGGGGGGGYSRVTLTAAGLGGTGKTFLYTIGAGGVQSTNGGASSIAAGTVTGFSSITCNGGAGATGVPGGAGGTVTNANAGAANTTGNAGTSGGGSTGTGGAGITGNQAGDGSPYAAGGAGSSTGGRTGGIGAVVFFYS